MSTFLQDDSTELVVSLSPFMSPPLSDPLSPSSSPSLSRTTTTTTENSTFSSLAEDQARLDLLSRHLSLQETTIRLKCTKPATNHCAPFFSSTSLGKDGEAAQGKQRRRQKQLQVDLERVRLDMSSVELEKMHIMSCISDLCRDRV